MPSNMLFIASFFILFHISLSADHCKDKEWLDDTTGKCQPCLVCPLKSIEVGPCLKSSNTLCVNLEEISRSLKTNRLSHKWHEMEGSDSQVYLKENVVSNITKDESDDLWMSQMTCFFISLSIFCFAVSFIIFCHRKYYKKINHIYDHRRGLGQGRFFSRDRLNTTEYMNNLASLDRSLAIDDILEKKKRALLEPVVLVDDVYVDISGLPPNYACFQEESDHKKCLLQIREQ